MAPALREIDEAGIRLTVSDRNRPGPPGARGPEPFFNPGTAFARDISLLYLAAVARPGGAALDALTGTGVRAIRWALACPGVTVTAVDRDPGAAQLAAHNVAINRARVRVLQRPLEDMLAGARYDFIDIDPFGSPAALLAGACRALRDGGHVLIAATDAMALAGAQPDVCRERYGARPLQCEVGHELALRILLGAVAGAAGAEGRRVHPTLAYAHAHWYAVGVRVHEAGGDAPPALGMAQICAGCAHRALVAPGTSPERCGACGGAARVAGPLWTGELWDAAVLDRMLEAAPRLAFRVEAALEGWRAEAGAPPLYFDMHAAARRCGGSAPSIGTMRERLRAHGHDAVRTHLAKVGIKTGAPAELVLACCRRGPGVA